MSTPKPELVVDPPAARGPDDDPRQIIYVSVDDVLIDPNVQRSVLQPRIDRMGEWDYDLAEGPTVSRRKNGQYIAIEGQGRVLHQQQQHPGSKMWMFVIEPDSENYAADEARIARRISGTRTQHTVFDRMSLERTAGDPYWQEATRALLYFGLEMTGSSGKGPNAVTAVGAIGTIMHSFDGVAEMSSDESVQAGSELLQDVISILREAYQYKPDKEKKGMYDRIMLLVVAGALRRHPRLDKFRLSGVLARLTPGQWKDEASRHRPGTSALDHLGKQVVDDYNSGKRDANKIAW